MAAEKIFETKIKQWLGTQGIYPLGTPRASMVVPPCGYWEKRWGGGPYVKAGLPDMHIVVRGFSLEVELKAENGRVSEVQRQKLKQINESGCRAMVLRPSEFEEFKYQIMCLKGAESNV